MGHRAVLIGRMFIRHILLMYNEHRKYSDLWDNCHLHVLIHYCIFLLFIHQAWKCMHFFASRCQAAFHGFYGDLQRISLRIFYSLWRKARSDRRMELSASIGGTIPRWLSIYCSLRRKERVRWLVVDDRGVDLMLSRGPFEPLQFGGSGSAEEHGLSSMWGMDGAHSQQPLCCSSSRSNV